MTQDVAALRAILHRIDGRGYKAYKEIQGRWRFPDFTLFIDHVQGDPFAAPTRARVLVPSQVAQFPPEHFSNPSRAWGLAAYLARSFDRQARQCSHRRGTTHRRGIQPPRHHERHGNQRIRGLGRRDTLFENPAHIPRRHGSRQRDDTRGERAEIPHVSGLRRSHRKVDQTIRALAHLGTTKRVDPILGNRCHR